MDREQTREAIADLYCLHHFGISVDDTPDEYVREDSYDFSDQILALLEGEGWTLPIESLKWYGDQEIGEWLQRSKFPKELCNQMAHVFSLNFQKAFDKGRQIGSDKSDATMREKGWKAPDDPIEVIESLSYNECTCTREQQTGEDSSVCLSCTASAALGYIKDEVESRYEDV